MTTSFDELDLSWIDELADNDYVILDNFLEQSLLYKVNKYLETLYQDGKFKKASIGIEKAIDKSIRGDFIYWLNPHQEVEEIKQYLAKMDQLIATLNRYCFLSISGKEFHFAVYPKGTFYARHLDQFKERDNRLISVVFYLNENWKSAHGGQLKVFKGDNEIEIEPVYNRLVLFKSDKIEHEVMLSHHERKSITGWLLYQPNGLGYLT